MANPVKHGQNGASALGGGSPHPRLLIVDDTKSIHGDFRKILGHENTDELERVEAALFGDSSPRCARKQFQIDSAYQGAEALELVQRAVAQNQPYSLAFVDVRMPPGWNGIETTRRLWQADPRLQIVICSAYSDYSWAQIVELLGASDSLVFLKKPFDTIEVLQLVHALTTKWDLSQQAQRRLEELDRLVAKRTEQLRLANDELRKDIAARKETELRLAAFAALGKRLNAARDAKAAALIITEIADQLLGWDACVCDLYSAAEERVFHLVNFDTVDGHKAEWEVTYTDHKPTSMAWKAIQEGGQIILRDDPETLPSDLLLFGNQKRSASILYVPIRNGEEVTGVLSIQSYKTRAYDSHSLETLQALADHCGAAFNRIRSEELLRQTAPEFYSLPKLIAGSQTAQEQ